MHVNAFQPYGAFLVGRLAETARHRLGQGLHPFAVLLGRVTADALGLVTSSAVVVAAAAVAEAALGVSLLASARFGALARASGPGDRPR